MDSNMFNTSDTNFSDVSNKRGESINAGINDLIANNNAQYKQRAQDAIAAAETKSRNFQKLGQLIADVGKFAPKFQEWNDSRSQLKAYRDKVKAGEANSKKLGGSDMPKMADIFTADSDIDFNMSLDKKVDDKFKDFLYREEEDEKFKNIFKESNAATVEGMQIAYDADIDFAKTGNLDILEEGIYANQSLTVADFDTKGKALVTEVGKSYQGFMLANQDTKVPVEGYGMVSLQDAMAANDGAGNPLMYDAVSKFLNESFYFTAEVFSGKNKMSNRHILQLIKSTEGTDQAARAQFLQQSYQKSKEQYKTKSRIDFANAIKSNPYSAIFGTKGDPNSGRLNQLQKMSGKKDTELHFQTMLDDMTWAVDNGYLIAADLNKIMAIEGIKDRHDGVTKSLGEFRPQFYQAVKVLHEKAGTREHDRKLKTQQNTVTTEVEKAQERLKKIEGGATEKDLLDEVNNVKKLLNDTHGIVVADDNSNQFWRYFQPLTGFVTNEDKVDIDTVKHIDNDLLQNDFENAEARLDEINDPKLREDVQKRIKGYDKIAQNKDLYDRYEKRIEQDVSTTLGNTLTTSNKELDQSVVIDNVKADLKKKFLYLTSKEGGNMSPEQALTQAEGEILKNLGPEDGVTTGTGRSKKVVPYAEYYRSGKGKRSLYVANAGRLARKEIEDETTREAWFKHDQPHDGEDIEALIQYARGGNIPEFYVEASRNMKFLNSHMIARMRLEALGYNEELQNLAPSVLNNFDNSVAKNLFYHPSSEKYLRVFQYDPENTSSFFPEFAEKTKNPDHGNVSGFYRERIDYDNTTIDDLVKEGGFAEKGYGTTGFGSFKLNAAQIERVRNTSGLDFKTDTFTKENQNKLYFAILMETGQLKKMFNGLGLESYAPSGLNFDDVEGLYTDMDKYNIPGLYTSSELTEHVFYYGNINEEGEIFYYGEDKE